MQRAGENMVDIKEIQCFVACVQTGSFSKAAESLFTTQSSVSRIIKAMEEEMGVPLFERQSKGIRLTEAAEQMYQYALNVLENIQKMQAPNPRVPSARLSVSCNPSSWFADAFVKFYELHQEESVHYQVYSANSREITERVRERVDDIGFVYVMKNQLTAFMYYLSRNYLEFEPLKETDIMIYPGGGCQEEIKQGGEIDFSDLKLIQRFPDEFSPDNYWNISDGNGWTAAEAETVITTNSDYIMERILEFGKVVNISGGYLTGEPWCEVPRGRKLAEANTRIQFGCVRRKGEELSECAAVFLEFLAGRLRDRE